MTDQTKYNPDIHHRQSIRLPGYDYGQEGAYFVTMCVHNRECLFGEIADGEIRLNEYGKIAEYTLNDLVNHIGGIELDEYVVMPNHIHGIIVIGVGAGSEPAPTLTATKRHALPEIVRQFKTFSARRINAKRSTPGVPAWQRNYYEHVIRDDDDLNRIREYIINNPMNWDTDKNNPAADSVVRNSRITQSDGNKIKLMEWLHE